MTGRTRRRWRTFCASRIALCALAYVPALASLPVVAHADGLAHSLADTARERAEQTATRVWHDATDLGEFALGLIGVRYRYGGDTPSAGLDCSGLIRYVFQQVTGVPLPRTARELSQVGTRVSLDDLQVGDLVFFNTRNYAFSHVGLYVGDNRFIHAPRRGRDVEITTLSRDYWQRHFNGARRLVGVLPALIPAVFPEALATTLTSLRVGPAEEAVEETPDAPGAP
ncbi:MAG TPA: C40 family peptidase [Casimicrobiaceae bacterium]|jgi:cell wall-associated NlpC family hydrolase